MSLDHWLAFVAASAVMLAIPGPTVLLVVSYALGYGRRPALAVVAGAALGGFTVMTASMLGLGAVIAASSSVFTALRWIGGAYLVLLGIKFWRMPVQRTEASGGLPPVDPVRMFAHAYAVTVLNPKGIIFFVAFVPQFIVPSAPFLEQATILVTTFLVLDVLNSTAFALLASTARRRLREARVQRIVNRTGGSLLVGAGIFAAVWRKTAN